MARTKRSAARQFQRVLAFLKSRIAKKTRGVGRRVPILIDIQDRIGCTKSKIGYSERLPEVAIRVGIVPKINLGMSPFCEDLREQINKIPGPLKDSDLGYQLDQPFEVPISYYVPDSGWSQSTQRRRQVLANSQEVKTYKKIWRLARNPSCVTDVIEFDPVAFLQKLQEYRRSIIAELAIQEFADAYSLQLGDFETVWEGHSGNRDFDHVIIQLGEHSTERTLHCPPCQPM